MTTRNRRCRERLAAAGLLGVATLVVGVCAPAPEQPAAAAEQSRPQASRAGGAPVKPLPPKAAFDGARAYEHLREVVAFGPRPAGSPALEQTRQYIRKSLAAVGVTVVEQPFEADTPVGRIRMVNLIARIPGASPERLIFAGHYETKLYREFRFVGANDAGSSSAFLIEWARVLQARSNRLTMELLFLDGEEAMLPDWNGTDHTYGSRHYVAAGKRDGSLAAVRAMVLLDMIGDRDLEIKREEASTRWLKDVIWGAARRIGHGGVFVNEETPIEDDHVPFLDAGVDAVDLIDLDYYPHWHTAGDTLDKVSARSMQIVGDVLAEALPEIERRAAATGRKR